MKRLAALILLLANTASFAADGVFASQAAEDHKGTSQDRVGAVVSFEAPVAAETGQHDDECPTPCHEESCGTSTHCHLGHCQVTLTAEDVLAMPDMSAIRYLLSAPSVQEVTLTGKTEPPSLF